MIQTMEIPNWHPARLNQLLGNWRKAGRLKRADREILTLYSRYKKTATGKRRVSLAIVLGPRQRGGDPDCWWKSTLDGLKHAGMILDDSKERVELGSVTYERGSQKATRITLEDLE